MVVVLVRGAGGRDCLPTKSGRFVKLGPLARRPLCSSHGNGGATECVPGHREGAGNYTIYTG